MVRARVRFRVRFRFRFRFTHSLTHLGLELGLGLGLEFGLGLFNCDFENNIWRHLLNIFKDRIVEVLGFSVTHFHQHNSLFSLFNHPVFLANKALLDTLYITE